MSKNLHFRKAHLLGIAVAAIAITPSLAYASCTGNKCTNVLVTRVFQTNADVTWITTNGNEAALNCNSYGEYVFVPNTDDIKDRMLSIFLTAKATGTRVDISFPSSGNCNITNVTWRP